MTVGGRTRIAKAFGLLRRPKFARALIGQGVAAAIEHLEAIHRSRAATLIDIGANKGQFSLAFRALRPDGIIIAFEPLPAAADQYEKLFEDDRCITLHRSALADVETEADFHVTDRRDCSSLLAPGAGQAAAFGVKNELVIRVPVRRLDRCVRFADLPRPIFLKIDVQGAELRVLKGCSDLELVDFIYVELSYVELYRDQPLFDEVFAYLVRRGFGLAGVFNQTSTHRYGPTQADVLFKRAGTE